MKIIIVLTAIDVLSSCRDREVAHSATGRRYSIDTITIHGVEHEFLYRLFNGIAHSPECPCLKKGE